MFANTDLLVSSVQRFQQWNLIDVPSIMGPRFHRINIFYSSPEYYTKMKYAETKKKPHPDTSTTSIRALSAATINSSSKDAGIEWKTKTDDFFPYSDCPHCFWTGTTRKCATRTFCNAVNSLTYRSSFE